MSPTPNQFRGLILASILGAVIGSSVDLVWPELIPQVLRDAHDAAIANDHSITGSLALDVLFMILAFGLAILGVVTLWGLWFFRWWSLRLAVATTVATYAIYPALGFNVASGWGWTLQEVSALLWGAVLAMAYFSPLRERFVRTDR